MNGHKLPWKPCRGAGWRVVHSLVGYYLGGRDRLPENARAVSRPNLLTRRLYAATSRRRVISAGTMNRLGGPQ